MVQTTRKSKENTTDDALMDGHNYLLRVKYVTHKAINEILARNECFDLTLSLFFVRPAFISFEVM